MKIKMLNYYFISVRWERTIGATCRTKDKPMTPEDGMNDIYLGAFLGF